MMMRHEDKVLTHRQLLTTLWGPAHSESIQYLRVYIGHLRHKLGTAVAQMIATEPNVGYRLPANAVAELNTTAPSSYSAALVVSASMPQNHRLDHR